jgi:hypothetical protein
VFEIGRYVGCEGEGGGVPAVQLFTPWPTSPTSDVDLKI